MGHLRETQTTLRQLTMAVAAGTRLAEPLTIQGQAIITFRLATDGQEH